MLNLQSQHKPFVYTSCIGLARLCLQRILVLFLLLCAFRSFVYSVIGLRGVIENMKLGVDVVFVPLSDGPGRSVEEKFQEVKSFSLCQQTFSCFHAFDENEDATQYTGPNISHVQFFL